MDLVDRLRNGIATLPAVRLAVLFGSTARGEARARSDVDLGVLLDPDTRDHRIHVEAELGRVAEREVDVIFLDTAPPLLRFEISRDGVLLFEKEDGLWTDFKVRAMVDWWDWAPYARMFTAAAVRRLRGETESNPRWLKRCSLASTVWLDNVEKFLSDADSQDLASFHLFLAIQECIDLAARWVADAGWGSPDEAGATFRVLMGRGAIDYELATKLHKTVNLRNRIAYNYSTVGHERLQAEYRDGVEALRQFLALVADEARL